MTIISTMNDLSGVISLVNESEALISFIHQGNWESAMVTNECFYFDGKKIPRSKTLNDYVKVGHSVKFSCEETPKPNDKYNFIATMCWRESRSPMITTAMRRSLDSQKGHVIKLSGRHGVINVLDGHRVHEILFLASKLYISGKRFAAGKLVNEILYINQEVIVNAIPSIADQNEEKCPWFATCVYLGKKPNIVYESTVPRNVSDAVRRLAEGRDACLRIISEIMHKPNTLFLCGKGMIMSVLDEEFGLIMAEIRKNVFETMLFHRKNLFLQKQCLSKYDIRDLLHEEDKVKFIAAGAPEGFATSWIAVQVVVNG